MRLTIPPRSAAWWFTIIVSALTLASVAGHLRIHFLGPIPNHFRYLFHIFDLDAEWNLPTYYQGMTLMLSAVLLILIGWHGRRAGDSYWSAWTSLGAIFVLLSLDEVALQLHEQIDGLLVRDKTFGTFANPWIILGAVFALVVGLSYLPFLFRHLSLKYRLYFIISGAIYVFGAVGMEGVGGQLERRYGLESLQYMLSADFEELMEMVGIAMFNVALLSYIGEHIGPVTLVFPAQHAAIASNDRALDSAKDDTMPIGASERV